MTLFFTILGLIASSQFVPTYAANSVPGLVWGGPSLSWPEATAVNPFKKTSQDEFLEIVRARVGPSRSPIVVLVENNLCVEDLTQHREALQRLTSGLSLQYIPAIEKPLAALENFDSYNQTEDEDIDTISEGQIAIRHVSNMDAVTEIYETLRESNPNVIGILTGRSCSFTRTERTKRAAPSNITSDFLVQTQRILFYCNQGISLKASKEELLTIEDLRNSSSEGTGTAEAPLVLQLDFKENQVVVKFVFLVESDGYYTLKHVDYSNQTSQMPVKLISDTEIAFPFTFSYHCSQDILFMDDNRTISLSVENMQVQVDAKTFGDAYDCVGFTTIPIWTGIFVTAILGLIMIWALTMIIDIRTMDRFDDPKGKTITISAQE